MFWYLKFSSWKLTTAKYCEFWISNGSNSTGCIVGTDCTGVIDATWDSYTVAVGFIKSLKLMVPLMRVCWRYDARCNFNLNAATGSSRYWFRSSCVTATLVSVYEIRMMNTVVRSSSNIATGWVMLFFHCYCNQIHKMYLRST